MFDHQSIDVKSAITSKSTILFFSWQLDSSYRCKFHTHWDRAKWTTTKTKCTHHCSSMQTRRRKKLPRLCETKFPIARIPRNLQGRHSAQKQTRKRASDFARHVYTTAEGFARTGDSSGDLKSVRQLRVGHGGRDRGRHLQARPMAGESRIGSTVHKGNENTIC